MWLYALVFPIFCKPVRFSFSSILQTWYVEVRISKYFRESIGLRDNESRLYVSANKNYPIAMHSLAVNGCSMKKQFALLWNKW